MTTRTATEQAISCVNNPPERLNIKSINFNLKDLQSVHTSFEAKSGLFNQLTNQRELSVTLFSEGKESTVIMNAYSGKCIRVTGPLE